LFLSKDPISRAIREEKGMELKDGGLFVMLLDNNGRIHCRVG
jgi:copper(I)-binding protein